MFASCTSLTSIPDMAAMYVGTSNGTMQRMFENCTSLSGEVTIGFSRDNTEIQQQTLGYIFSGCDSLTKIVIDFSALAAVIPLR